MALISPYDNIGGHVLMGEAQPLQIELFGGLRLRCGDAAGSEFRTRKTALLLAYLACHPGRRHAREVMAELLWPGNSPETNSGNLRTALWALRRQFTAAGHGAALIATQTHIGLDATVVTTDIAQFEAALQAAATAENPATEAHHLSAATSLYSPVLPGFYDDWVLAEQQRLEDLYFRALDRLVRRLQEMNDGPGAMRKLRQGIAHDTLREELYQQLFQWQIAERQPEAARQTYRNLERVLRDRLGSEPDAVTRGLLPISGQEGDPAAVGPLTGAAGLPQPLSSLIGRERDLTAVGSLLRRADLRLVTLTGPPGIGKTRLALETGRAVNGEFMDGVFFVPLAPISDPAQLPSAIMAALKIKETPGYSLLALLQFYLQRRQALLIVDNFEHVVDAAGTLQELLAGCEQLTVLATSRMALGISGEHRYVVPPLALPAASQNLDAHDIAAAPAMRLFVDRARAVAGAFEVTAANAQPVREICRRLDGLPLAIELAAARSNVLSPAALLDRLKHSFAVLAEGPRHAPSRQRTLREAIAWSYELLNDVEKTVFRRLAIFRGGCTLAAAEDVCAAAAMGSAAAVGTTNAVGDGVTVGDDQPRDMVLNAIDALIARNLVTRSEGPAALPRFGMLEMILEFAGEELRSSGEGEALARRHCEYYLRSFQEALAPVLGAQAPEWMERLRAENDNVCAAMRWSMDHDALLALRLADATSIIWVQERRDEWPVWLETVVNQTEAIPPLLHARSLLLLGQANRYDPHCVRLFAESHRLYRECGDEINAAWTALEMALGASDRQQAASLFEYALDIFKAHHHEGGIALVYSNMSNFQDTWESAHAYAMQAVEALRAQQNKLGLVGALHHLVKRKIERMLWDEVRDLAQEQVTLGQEVGHLEGQCWGHLALASRHVHCHEPAAAHSTLKAATLLARETADPGIVFRTLTAAADSYVQLGDHASAMALFEEVLPSMRHGNLLDYQHLAVLRSLGVACRQAGYYEKSRRHLAEGLHLLETGKRQGEYYTPSFIWEAGNTEYAAGCHHAALECYARGLEANVRLEARYGPWVGITVTLEALGCVALALDDIYLAVTLWGAAECVRERDTGPYVLFKEQEVDALVPRARQLLGETAFGAAWDEGRALTRDEAIRFAQQAIQVMGADALAQPAARLRMLPGAAGQRAGQRVS